MDISYLKSEFLKHKVFLLFLFENNPRKNAFRLKKSNNEELNILIKILFLICTGKISLRNEDFLAIKQSKRLNKLKFYFDSTKKLLEMLKKSPEEKSQLLKMFAALYKYFLFTMFHKI